jgi:ketosteroid isomerase-like protein
MTSLSDQLLEAMRSLDADALTDLLAPDAVVWRNVGTRDRTAQDVIDMLRVERELIRSSTLRVRHQSATDDGFVVQFVLAGTTKGGADFELSICIVAHVADGRIVAFEEYADETSLQPLMQEFLASAQESSA